MKKTMKRILSTMLVVVITIGIAPLSGFVDLELPEFSGFKKLADSVSEFFESFGTKAEAIQTSGSGTCGDNLTWTFGSYTLTISGTGTMTNYSQESDAPWIVCNPIHTVIIDNGVTSIGDYDFSDCYALRSITIPSSVKSIGKRAFYKCDDLTNISIPDGVTSIGEYTFSGCKELTSIKIPNSVINIEWSAFSNCTALTNITIPDSVTSIGHYAFLMCSSLTSITIPDSVTNIGSVAFGDCTSLASITIPDSVTSIGESAFSGCTSLESIKVDSDNQYFSNDSYGVLFNKDKTLLVSYPLGHRKTVYEIPDSVTTIGSSAFSGCTGLTDIKIPNSVTSIDRCAFSGCTNFTSITIPDSVTNIDYGAFFGCTSLTKITIPKSVTSIGGYVFSNCSALTTIDIPDSITTISYYAFEDCANLTNIKIPDSITNISNNAFSGCVSLTNIKIPESVTDIGSYAFSQCTGLTGVKIPDSVNIINKGTFNGCSGLKSIEIPDSVTCIDEYAFANCLGFINVTIPDEVRTIGKWAFSNCSGLTGIIIPISVRTIDWGAFYKCDKLTDIYYIGTEESWNIIDIDKWCNDPLLNATIHYNYAPSFFEFNPGFRAMINSERSYIFSEDGTFDTDSFEIDLLIKNDETFIEGVTASQTEAISAIITLPEGFSFSQTGDVFAKRIEFSPVAVGASAEETLTVYVTDPEMEKPLQISAEIFKESSSEPIRKTFCSITATSDENFLGFELPNDVYVSADERSATNTLSTMSQLQANAEFVEEGGSLVLKSGTKKKIDTSIIYEKSLKLKGDPKKGDTILTINGNVTVKGNIEIEQCALLVVNGSLNCTGDIIVGGTLRVNNWLQAKNITTTGYGTITNNRTIYLFNRLKISTANSVFNMTDLLSTLYTKEIFFDAGKSNISAGTIYAQKITADGDFKTTDSCKIVLLYKDEEIPNITRDKDGGFWPNLIWVGVDKNIKTDSNLKPEEVNVAISNILKCSSECYEVSVEYKGNFVSRYTYTEDDVLTGITTLDMLKKEIEKARDDILITDNKKLTERTKKELKEAILVSRAILYSKSCEKLSSYSPSSVTIEFVNSEGVKCGFTLYVNPVRILGIDIGELTYGEYYVYTEKTNIIYGNKITGTIDYADAHYEEFGNSVNDYIKNEWKDELAGYIGDGVGKAAVKGLFNYGLSSIYSVSLENVVSIAIEGALTKNSHSSTLSSAILTNSISRSAEDLTNGLSTQSAKDSSVVSVQDILETQATSSDFDLTAKKGFEDKYLIQAVLSYLGLSSLDELTDDIASSVTTLDLSGQNIKSIEGLQNFTNLQTLYLDNNNIYDLSPVQNIGSLTYLSANKTFIQEVSSINSLQYFSVADCLLEDIGALDSMTNLRYLDINQNYIFSIDAVLDLVSIILLNISGNSLDSDIGTQTLSTSSASGKCAPEYLYADDCGLSDLSMFDLSNIKEISVSSNEISSTEDICMPDAETIDFSDNEITDIEFIKDSPNLKNLDVSHNNISELPQELADKASNFDSLNLEGNELKNTEENQDIMGSLSENINGFDKVELGIPVLRVDFVLDNNVIDIRKQIMLSYSSYPVEADTDKMIWTSSDDSVLTVENGIITPKTLGEAVVTVTNAEGEILGSTIVTVVEFETVNVEEILISTETLTLESGKTEQLQAFCLPLNATTRTVSWSSDNPSVVSVDKNGLVTAVKVGTATITATSDDGGFTVQCKVTVEPRMCTVKWNVEGKITEQSVLEGDEITLPATPQKSGFKFVGWTPAVPEVMPAYDMTFTAVFDLAFSLKIKTPSRFTIDYNDSIWLHAEIEGDLPAGARIIWTPSNNNFIISEASEDGKSCKVTSKVSGTTTFTVSVVDENENVLTTATQDMTSKAGLWQKITAFFKKIFGATKTFPELYKSLF